MRLKLNLKNFNFRPFNFCCIKEYRKLVSVIDVSQYYRFAEICDIQ